MSCHSHGIDICTVSISRNALACNTWELVTRGCMSLYDFVWCLQLLWSCAPGLKIDSSMVLMRGTSHVSYSQLLTQRFSYLFLMTGFKDGGKPYHKTHKCIAMTLSEPVIGGSCVAPCRDTRFRLSYVEVIADIRVFPRFKKLPIHAAAAFVHSSNQSSVCQFVKSPLTP